MEKLVYKNKEYPLDSYGFLSNADDWDENFAEGMALSLNIPDGLKKDRMRVIYYIREVFLPQKTCPTIYDTMEHFNFTLKEFRILFPPGYQQGACKIAGISYEKGFLTYHSFEKEVPVKISEESKVYKVNSKGFLIDWTEWDEEFAINKADELKMPNLLTGEHWKIIHYLREHYNKTHTIANIYEMCDKINITLDDLKDLFPDGYHRGAVKIAGLRLK